MAFLTAIDRSVQRMETITSEILSLEQIEQKARMSKAHPLDLRALVEKAGEEHREQAHLKSQMLLIGLCPEAVTVVGDPVQLYEAVANLISNAIKYTPAGGQISVSIKRNEQKAIFLVEDNGYGIPKDQQSQLFQPFFRVSSQETAAIDGTGLGLHLVKNIVERHKGEIIFHSTYGQGSTFGFEVPCSDTS